MRGKRPHHRLPPPRRSERQVPGQLLRPPPLQGTASPRTPAHPDAAAARPPPGAAAPADPGDPSRPIPITTTLRHLHQTRGSRHRVGPGPRSCQTCGAWRTRRRCEACQQWEAYGGYQPGTCQRCGQADVPLRGGNCRACLVHIRVHGPATACQSWVQLRPGRAPGWTVAGPAEPDRAGQTTARGPEVIRSASAQWSGQPPRSADADRSARRASGTARAGICRTSWPRAGRPTNGTAARAGAAPSLRSRGKEPAHADRAAVRHGGAPTLPGTFTPEGCLAAGRLSGARRAGPPTANAAPRRRRRYFPAPSELFSCSVMNSDAEAGIGVCRLAH